MKKTIKVGKGHKTYRLRLSRAKITTPSRSRTEAVRIVRIIYPELEKEDKFFWKLNMVHHIDKDPFNNDPNNLAIILKNEHWIYHRKQYNWKERYCFLCEKDTLHLNTKCTICGARFKKKYEIPQSIRA